MGNAIRQYFAQLTQAFGQGWNRFWFTPSDPITVCVVRIVAGAAALLYVGSFTFDLERWFGPNGFLPVETIQRVMETQPGEGAAYQWSYLNYIDSLALLWVAHAAALVIVAMFALGLFTRVTSVLALITVLSYIHRAPVLAAQFEPVLATMILYLCVSPCGRYLSLDNWRRRRRAGEPRPAEISDQSWLATVGVRLVQVHLAMLYLIMALAKLEWETWWDGGAVWWLMAQPQSRLVDLTFLRENLLLINAWTHAMVLFELAYGVLIWNRLARPLLIGASVVMWTLTALLTGLVPFCLLMIAAGAAFVPPATWRSLLGSQTADAHSGAGAKSQSAEEAATAA
jgi:hypothetical protein